MMGFYLHKAHEIGENSLISLTIEVLHMKTTFVKKSNLKHNNEKTSPSSP